MKKDEKPIRWKLWYGDRLIDEGHYYIDIPVVNLSDPDVYIEYIPLNKQMSQEK